MVEIQLGTLLMNFGLVTLSPTGLACFGFSTGEQETD